MRVQSHGPQARRLYEELHSLGGTNCVGEDDNLGVLGQFIYVAEDRCYLVNISIAKTKFLFKIDR